MDKRIGVVEGGAKQNIQIVRILLQLKRSDCMDLSSFLLAPNSYLPGALPKAQDSIAKADFSSKLVVSWLWGYK